MNPTSLSMIPSGSKPVVTAPRGLEPDLVRDAYARFGEPRYACEWLGCTRQAIGNPHRPELARAAREGRAMWLAARVAVRLKVPPALARRLARRAKKAGLDRATWCARAVEGLATLPEVAGRPRDAEGRLLAAGASKDGDMVGLQFRLPADVVARWREECGDDFAARLRAALAKA